MARVRSVALLLVVLTNTYPALGAAADMPLLPPLPTLNEPATHVHLPGKFVWADYFRLKFSERDVRRRWDKTLEAALARAHDRDARFLPGWCGRD